MKVRALNHIIQKVGTLSVERVLNTVFEVDEDTAVKAIAAGLVEAAEAASPKKIAKNRETK